VAFAYAAIGAGTFQKRADGRMSVAARWLFAPYLAGAWINSRAWTWRDAEPVEIADGVFLGRVPGARHLSAFTGVVDMTAEFDMNVNGRVLVAIPVLDLTRPTASELTHAAQAIERLREQGPVLVCCALGYSRSACAVAAWLISSGRANAIDVALAMIRRARERI